MELRLGCKLWDSQAWVPERPSRKEQMLSFESTPSILCSSVVVLNSFGGVWQRLFCRGSGECNGHNFLLWFLQPLPTHCDYQEVVFEYRGVNTNIFFLELWCLNFSSEHIEGFDELVATVWRNSEANLLPNGSQ